MSKRIDLSGRRYGKLTVLQYSGSNGSGRACWACACDCGKHSVHVGKDLVAGKIKSCGCNLKTRHGKVGSGAHTSWRGMMERCTNPKNRCYRLYGGRGIGVCDRWADGRFGFLNFLADMGERPRGKTLDRIDCNVGYQPSNCRWATPTEQHLNSLKVRDKKGRFSDLFSNV
jgi:hypothetical protein